MAIIAEGANFKCFSCRAGLSFSYQSLITLFQLSFFRQTGGCDIFWAVPGISPSPRPFHTTGQKLPVQDNLWQNLKTSFTVTPGQVMLLASVGWSLEVCVGRGGMDNYHPVLRTPLHSHAASTEADKPSSHCNHILSSMQNLHCPKH